LEIVPKQQKQKHISCLASCSHGDSRKAIHST